MNLVGKMAERADVSEDDSEAIDVEYIENGAATRAEIQWDCYVKMKRMVL